MTETQRPNLRESLLSQGEPELGSWLLYRLEMETMLSQQENRLRWQYWYTGAIWIFVVLLGTVFLFLGANMPNTPIGVHMGILAVFLLIAPAVELIKYFLNRQRLEILKEIKGLELRIMQLQEQLEKKEVWR